MFVAKINSNSSWEWQMRIWEPTFTFDHFGSNTKPAIYSVNNVCRHRHITDWTVLKCWWMSAETARLQMKVDMWHLLRLLARKSQCYVNNTPVRSLMCLSWKICLLGLKYCISICDNLSKGLMKIKVRPSPLIIFFFGPSPWLELTKTAILYLKKEM